MLRFLLFSECLLDYFSLCVTLMCFVFVFMALCTVCMSIGPVFVLAANNELRDSMINHLAFYFSTIIMAVISTFYYTL